MYFNQRTYFATIYDGPPMEGSGLIFAKFRRSGNIVISCGLNRQREEEWAVFLKQTYWADINGGMEKIT